MSNAISHPAHIGQGLHVARATGHYPASWIASILMASVCYLALLSFANARGLQVSPVWVGLVETLVYLACLIAQIRRVPLVTVALSCCVFAWVVFSWLIRQSPDLKGLRDLIIPILFVSLGRYVADVRFADVALKRIVLVLVVLGLFEALFTDAYGRLFNTFSFYVNLGGIRESSAMFEGQMLTLNGFRPEGIGRTIFPGLLGAHRTSSALMEPVSLGNFGVILLAWALSRSWKNMRHAVPFLLGAALLIALSDSRFGLAVGAVLIALRCVPLAVLTRLAPAIPFLSLGIVIALASLLPGAGDNVLGRITRSGTPLLDFDWAMILGLHGPLPNFGDMGFAYVISRFGAPLCIGLILAIFMVPMPDARGLRFRIFVVVYIFANFAVSGTSVFALKTAGVMWFLFGVLSAASALPKRSSV
ncbi:MAG: polysaccharide polymerase [Rhodoferax sp.]|nr:polysaccharide polymerase [Rhodoferax sp.]